MQSGSNSWVPQTPLGIAEELVLGSLCHTEARDNRFSFLNIPDAAVCERAENKEGTLRWTLARGRREKAWKRELWLGSLRVKSIWVAQGACLVGGLVVVEVAGYAERSP